MDLSIFTSQFIQGVVISIASYVGLISLIALGANVWNSIKK
jgi:hypothetical protein